jgi:hypothetical protein
VNQTWRRNRAEQVQNALAELQMDNLEEQGQQPEAHTTGDIPDDPDSAISSADRQRLQAFRDAMMEVKLELCPSCHEEWFDLDIKQSTTDGEVKCARCRKSTKWTAANAMYPGPDPSSPGVNLPGLTQMEEMMLAPIHVLLQVWQVRGGQTKYTGHICNFFRDVGEFHNRVPRLPEECDIILLRRRNRDGEFEQAANSYEDFRVRRDRIHQWLIYLKAENPAFENIEIDYERLNSLPENELVHNRLHSILEDNLQEQPVSEEGPPEAAADTEDVGDVPAFSSGFVPDLANRDTEIGHLQAAAGMHNENVLLSVPHIRGTPIREDSEIEIAIQAFPTLFPTGVGGFRAQRSKAVTMKEWAVHMLKIEGLHLPNALSSLLMSTLLGRRTICPPPSISILGFELCHEK